MLFVPRYSRAILQFTLTHRANINMVVTRSQRPKSGSPTAATPAEPAPVEAPPAVSKKAQKSKAKAKKTAAAATGQKPAKVRKRKTPKRKGPKSASKKSPEALQATSKPSSNSEASLKAIAEAALEKFSNSDALFAPSEFTPELLEELGLAYVDMPPFTAYASDGTTQAEPQPAPRHTYLKTGPGTKDGRAFPPGFSINPWLFPEHWVAGAPFGAHDTVKKGNSPPADPQTTPAVPGAFPRSPPSLWSKKSSVSQPTPAAVPSGGALHPVTWASPITPSFGAQASPIAYAGGFISRELYDELQGSASVPSPPKATGSNQLSPRGVRAGGALLNAVESPASSPMDFIGLFSHGSYATRQNWPVDPSKKAEGTAKSCLRSPITVVRDIVNQVEEQPVAPRSPSTRLFGLQPSEASRNADDEAEEESSDSPVSVNNAQVFKRPTVADLRRERAQMHDELHDWVGSLRDARAEFNEMTEGVIGEIEARMRVLKAVNRIQAPLRKAPLGRGRGRGRSR
jgi:hypothetical protein